MRHTSPIRASLLAGVLAALLAAPVLLDAPASASARPGDPSAPVQVVVQAEPGAGQAAADAVRRLGGTVTRSLPIVGGLAASVPAGAVAALGAADGVRTVSANRALQVQAAPPERNPVATPSDPSTAVPLAPRVVRAPEAWAAGVQGEGVTVALVDTGVSDTPDLRDRIKPVQTDEGGTDTATCYDLSGEGNCNDTYGHGTFMAGLIAGDGTARGGQAIGVAPKAKIVSVKVAGATGATDVSTVLAAIQWVVSFRSTYGIGVLNLSLGTDSLASWRSDPLNYAVEQAWQQGIVVVVAAANNGPAAGTIAKPGDDPWVITVGATDSRGTVGLGDDRLPDFSSRGPAPEGVVKPDVVGPGSRVQSLRSWGSTIEKDYPNAEPGRYRRGSGTSMATAVVSGVVALVRSANPGLSPNQVKYALKATARPVAASSRTLVGSGMVDAYATALAPPPGSANAGLARSSGLGALDLSRGSWRVETDALVPTAMQGRQTAQLVLWQPADFLGVPWTPSGWFGRPNALLGYNTLRWSDPQGQNWSGQNWSGQNWSGSSFYGQHEDGTPYGRTGNGSGSYGGWD